MTTQQEQKEQQRRQWSAAAPGWEKWHAWSESQTKPLLDWFCRAADAGPGKRILDVACGAGQPALSLALEARPAGQVVAIDLSSDMVEAARRNAAAAGITNVEFKEMDAEDLKFEDASFDAVTSRWGLMFCPDPVRAASEMRRVLKRGCPFAISVWDDPAKNPFFGIIAVALSQVAPPAQPPDPKAPNPFRLGPPGELESVLKGAGFTSFNIESRPMTWEYESPEKYWEIQTEMAAPLKAAVATLPANDVARLKQAVLKAVEPFIVDGRVRFAAVPLCASGVK